MYARAKQGLPFIDLSRLFPYWNARVAEGDIRDDGATIGGVVWASIVYGDCPYADLPTNSNLVSVQPSSGVYADAIKHKTVTATRVPLDPNHVKHCISVLKVPVIVGISVYESFEWRKANQTGMIPMPGPNEKMIGGHCVDVVEYDDPSRLALCDNSWGTGWGNAGQLYLPYAYLFDSGLSADFHAITFEES